MNMYKLLITASVLIASGLLSGCGTVTSHVQLEPCPRGERCADFVASPMQARGGGIHKVTFLTQTNRDGQQVTAPVVTSTGALRWNVVPSPN